MVDFYHSDGAENIMHMFYGADNMVYVEGIDDVPFWELIFSKVIENTVEVQDVGGSKELEKYAQKVLKGDLEGVIACDSDFEVIKNTITNPRIIRTFGYSIENSLICPTTIEKVIKNVGKLSLKRSPKEQISNWIGSFNSSVERLVYYDIYNELESYGIAVIGDNCSRFLKSKNSYEICQYKINSFIASLEFDLSEESVNDIIVKLNKLPRTTSDFVRGHFLFSAAARFISSIIKQLNSKTSISNDALFGSLLLAFENTFDKTHPHYDYYKGVIKDAKIAV